ncbi:MAG: ABC transporter permease subunit [Planctomycetota bacterium]|nr:ABC transporter permease subunit [Planctomycetota bacterium]
MIPGRLLDRAGPAAVGALLLAFFAVGLVWPLGHGLVEAVHEAEVRAELREGESLEAFARRNGVSVTDLYAHNRLPTMPSAGTSIVVRPSRWTLEHVFGLFAADAAPWRWILNSLFLAVVVTALCVALSFPLAYWQVRTRFPGQALLGGLLLLPLVLPPFVGAIGLRRLLSRYGSVNLLLGRLGLGDLSDPIDFLGEHRMLGCVVVMVLHFYPLIYLNLCAALGNIDPSLLESARSLGLSPWQVARRVILPLSAPGLIAGGSLVFVGAFTDLGTPLVFNYQEVVAQQIFSLANQQSTNPAAPALVAVVTLLVVTLFALTRWSLSRYQGLGGGGKGATRGAPEQLRGKVAFWPVAAHLFVVALALLPHLSVVLSGLAGTWFDAVLPESWTLAHVKEALAHPTAQAGVRNSLLYALGSTAVDIVLGLACAWVIVRRGGWAGRAMDALTLAPLAIPGIVLAFGYVGVYAKWYSSSEALLGVGWYLVLGYAVRRLPYTTRACAAGLEQTPKALEEAGGSLGAPPGRVLAKITVPLIAANVAAGAILAFAFAMLEVSDSLILAQRPADYPLTKAIYALFGRVGDGDQLASALGLFALAFMALSLLSAAAFLGRKWGEMFRG